MKNKFILLILFLLLNLLPGQDWLTITSVNGIADIALDDETIWAATKGGVFRYNTNDESQRIFTNIDGMESVLVYAVTVDDHNQVICGGEKGLLEIYDKNSDSWHQQYELAGYPIYDIKYQNDSLWVVADNGLAAFIWDGSQFVFNDFFVNFGTLPGEVRAVELFNNRVWLATDIGVFSAPSDLSRYVLNNPDLWQLYSNGPNLASASINALMAGNDFLYVGNAGGLSRIAKDGTVSLESGWQKDENNNYLTVTALAKSGQTLYAASNKTLYRLESGSTSSLAVLPDKIITVLTDQGGKVWASTDGSGLYHDGWTEMRKLDGPTENVFRNVLRSNDGRLWALTGNSTGYTEQGYYVYDGNKWRSYIFSGGNWTYLYASIAIYQDRFENIWIGSWGGGLMVYPAGSDMPVFFHNHNSANGTMYINSYDQQEVVPLSDATVYQDFFSGVVEATNYEIITDIKEDYAGRIWFANYWAANNQYLAVAPYTEDGFVSTNKDDWMYFGLADGIATATASRGYISCIEHDDFGRVWIGTLKDGVYVLDYNNTLYDKSDDEVYHLDIGDNLYSNTIYSLASDADGLIWIGTASGLNSYDGVNVYKHVGDPDGKDGPLENRINHIFVDKVNNKWFSTPGGLSILRAGQSAWDAGAWEGYTTENSGLVADNVYASFVDQTNGKAYVATSRGLSVYSGTFAEIRDDFSQIIGGPNPFLINAGSELYTIKNLMHNSTVKIFTINGALIRELNSSGVYASGQLAVDGSRAYWDGKDSRGVAVDSGIYLYSAYTIEGQSVSGKIAVIRE